jgi:hypothetical protein
MNHMGDMDAAEKNKIFAFVENQNPIQWSFVT